MGRPIDHVGNCFYFHKKYFTLELIIRGPDFLLRQSLDRLPARMLLEEVVVEVVARVLLSLVTPAPA